MAVFMTWSISVFLLILIIPPSVSTGYFADLFAYSMQTRITTEKQLHCYHCGEVCITAGIQLETKHFCCEGCKMVFQVLNEYELCEYYILNQNPGITQRVKIRKDKFAFLEDKSIQSRLITFSDDNQVHVVLYLPQVHCSSCLYLLENLHRLEPGVISSKVNFTRKEVTVVFMLKETSLRKVVELSAGRFLST